MKRKIEDIRKDVFFVSVGKLPTDVAEGYKDNKAVSAANEKNLIPLNKRAKSVQREIQSKGGKAKAKKEKEKKTYREMLNTLLTAEIEDEKVIEDMKCYGIKETNVKAYTLFGMIKASATGSPQAFDKLLDLSGEREKASSEEEEKQEEMLRVIEEAVKNDN